MSAPSFPPTSFFPDASSSSLRGGAALGDDLTRVGVHCRSLLQQAAAAAPPGDVWVDADLSILVGPKKTGKSRLLLQLSYRLAAEALDPAAAAHAAAAASASVAGAAATAAAASPSAAAAEGDAAAALLAPPAPVTAAIVGDPFQPVLLLLPKSRNSASAATAGASGGGGGSSSKKGAAPPLVGLFGPHLNAAVLQKIKIKWYDDDQHLLKLLCALHLQSARCPSNVSGVPPRFVGLLYDARLSTEAAHVALVMARLSEAIAAINYTSQEGGAFARCQGLFVMSHVASVGRLKTLLPRYARCVFEVTESSPQTKQICGDKSGLLLHTRPMVNPTHVTPSVLSSLLTPLASLASSEKLLPTHKDVHLTLARMTGVPVLKYTITETELAVTAILV